MRNFFRFSPDSVGFWTSLLCGLHCVILPFALTFFSSGFLSMLGSPFMEGLIIGISITIGMFSLLPGYSVHKKPTPVYFLVGGFILIAMSRLNFSMAWEMTSTFTGALLVAYAHYSNWKVSHNHKSSLVEKVK